MNPLLEEHRKIVGSEEIYALYQLARPLKGIKVVHVNSTRTGGGVAEILTRMIPLMGELGLDVRWEVIEGEDEFYECTKSFHNALQGNAVDIPERLLKIYEKTNEKNAARLGSVLEKADIVFIHDPQPAFMIRSFPERKAHWVWRCHIDLSHPYRPAFRYLRRIVSEYDASIFSLADFARPLPHPQYLIPPSIDPLSEKNIELSQREIGKVLEEFGIDPDRPIIAQVSRYDRFKDPIGVIQAFHLARKYMPSLQLILCGGGATDDPEGEEVLREVQEVANQDPDIHVLLLPPETITRKTNAIQRAADIILQKSTREGFGMTVTEAMWKGKPVIGGNTGGIRLQVVDHHTGFLVSTPEGAALRIRYLFHHRRRMRKMGEEAKEFVRKKFLITRHIRDYLALIHGVMSNNVDSIDIS